MDEGTIDKSHSEDLRPRGSQPARLCGLAKIHQKGTPLRPVLSVKGSAYHNVAKKVEEWSQNAKYTHPQRLYVTH